MDDDLKWFEEFNASQTKRELSRNPIAYFCAEYALSSNIPSYAGGLGVLAGDFLREAEEKDLPVVAVGLYYNDGYETLHKVDQKGYIEAPHVHSNPESFGLEVLLDESQKPLLVVVPIQDRDIKVRVWVWHMGKIKIYLLDSDVPENSESDRKITDHLYVADQETRLKQEIILGIGGARLLEILKIEPSIYHMNEGHSCLLGFEVIKHEMQKKGIGFDEARKIAARKIVFTNHTLVAGGNEIVSQELFSLLLAKYAETISVPIGEIIKIGKVKDSNSFSMTIAALNLAGKINAVSHLHAKKAEEMWPEYQIIPITNGIHYSSWNSIFDESALWESHVENKRELLAKVNQMSEETWSDNTLIIGWARRLTSYKRPLALFENIERLKTILTNNEHPVRIVLSGTLHPSDTDGEKILGDLRRIADTDLKGLMVFLPGYSIELAKIMTAGSDIWLNTPIVGFEACGTSGMKAALNGDLSLSTRDGWMDEIELYGIGWPLDNDKINASILDALEQNIIPLYFDKNGNSKPEGWIQNMKNARDLIKNEFTTTRMLREYIEKLYTPLLT